MDKLIIVIDDAAQNGFALQQWLASGGQRSERLATYAEMSATIAYQQVAGFLPGLIIGPMTAEGAAFAQALRTQTPGVAFAFYTESPARWQDDQIRRQFGCVAILHKPFAADRVEVLGLTTGPALELAYPGAPPAPKVALPPEVAFTPGPQRANTADWGHLFINENARLPPIPAGAPPPQVPESAAFPSSAMSATASGALVPQARSREEAGAALQFNRASDRFAPPDDHIAAVPTSGPNAHGAAGAAAHAGASSGNPGSRPYAFVDDDLRQLPIVIVDDRFNSARQLADHLHSPATPVRKAATYKEAADLIERFKNPAFGLLIGPMSVDGVALSRKLRASTSATEVVFYTDSQSQSQDPQLPIQYGCLGIVRRPFQMENIQVLVRSLRDPGRTRITPGTAAVTPGTGREGGTGRDGKSGTDRSEPPSNQFRPPSYSATAANNPYSASFTDSIPNPHTATPHTAYNPPSPGPSTNPFSPPTNPFAAPSNPFAANLPAGTAFVPPPGPGSGGHPTANPSGHYQSISGLQPALGRTSLPDLDYNPAKAESDAPKPTTPPLPTGEENTNATRRIRRGVTLPPDGGPTPGVVASGAAAPGQIPGNTAKVVSNRPEARGDTAGGQGGRAPGPGTTSAHGNRRRESGIGEPPPGSSLAAMRRDQPPSPPPPPAAPPSPPPQPQQTVVRRQRTLKCVRCGQQLMAQVREIAYQMDCPHCGQSNFIN